jgi:hypothetical protein
VKQPVKSDFGNFDSEIARTGLSAIEPRRWIYVLSKWAEEPAGSELTPNIHSSHDLNRPEAKRFRIKLTDLNIPKIDLVDTHLRDPATHVEATNITGRKMSAPGY